MYLRKPLIARCIALFAAVFLFLNAVDLFIPGREGRIYEGVIRLHVIADGDSEEQQRMKLLVRDRILSQFSGMFSGADGFGPAFCAVNESLPQIRAAANDALAANGADYSAEVFLVRERYPTCDYGGISLPAGDYCSLKTVLGSGSGKNWWCVMFPPLCFGASGRELGGTPVGERSARVFTKKKYIIRFKLLELFG